MKKILVLLLSLLTFGLNAQGTKLKIKQLENPGTSSLNLGANSFSAGAQSTISTLYVPNTATVNGAFLGNSTGTISGALLAGSTLSVASNFTAVGTGSIGSTFTVNGAMLANSSLTVGAGIVQNTYVGSGAEAYGIRAVAPTGATANYAIYASGDYVQDGGSLILYGNRYVGSFDNTFSIRSNNSVRASFSQGGVISLTPSSSITATGSMVVSDAATTFGGSALTQFRVVKGTSTVDIGAPLAGGAGIWLNQTTPALGNYNILKSGNNTFYSTNSSGTHQFVINNGSTLLNVGANTSYFLNPLRVGSSTAPSATLDVTGTMSVSSTGRTGTISTSASYSPALSVLATGNAITGSGMGLYTENSTGGRNFAFLLNDNQYGDFVIRQGTALGSDPFAGNRRFVISPEGNIGINNASPAATLQVSGTMSVSSTSTLTGQTMIGANSAPLYTLDVAGNFHASSTSSLNGLVTIGRQLDANVANISINSGAANTNAFQIATDQPNALVILNSRNSYSTALSLNDVNRVWLSSVGFSVAPTTTLNGLNLASGGYSVTTKVIDATAGDAVTINSPVGQFRKDVTGTTFVLTNSQITANSVIMLTAANAAIDATATGWTISKGAGSATITFNAAPTANFDMMFMIMN